MGMEVIEHKGVMRMPVSLALNMAVRAAGMAVSTGPAGVECPRPFPSAALRLLPASGRYLRKTAAFRFREWGNRGGGACFSQVRQLNFSGRRPCGPGREPMASGRPPCGNSGHLTAVLHGAAETGMRPDLSSPSPPVR